MTRKSVLPRNEDGTPHRFEGHGEGIRWATGTVFRRFGKLLVPGTAGGSAGVGGVRHLSSESEPLGVPDPASILLLVVSVLALLLAAGVACAVVLYLYLALSGGVKGRAERSRIR